MIRAQIKFILLTGVVLFSICLQLSALTYAFSNQLQNEEHNSIVSTQNSKVIIYTSAYKKEELKSQIAALLFENQEEDESASKKRLKDRSYIIVFNQTFDSLFGYGVKPLPHVFFSNITSHRYLLFQVFRV